MHTGSFVPSIAWTLPFLALLLSIAVLPLAAPRFWESNLRKLGVAALLALPVLVLYAGARPEGLHHAAESYVSFIVLLAGLFVISGGILLEGDLEATPGTNAAFLGTGALLASFVGTTGASMLLIRPLLQTNRERKHVTHTVVFFIFLVSNIGGCLTPLGDPPLFLGYLLGVPFAWTFRLFVPWLVTSGLVLAIYVLWDLRAHAREARADLKRDFYEVRRLRVAGRENLALLLGVLAAVAFLREPWREVAIVALAV
ncbi:MAG TPA: sodium:proton antiporter, partial [Vicinamibacteria bacterium]